MVLVDGVDGVVQAVEAGSQGAVAEGMIIFPCPCRVGLFVELVSRQSIER